MAIDIHIFIINLESDVDRRKYMEQQCTEQGLTCQFVSAVNGKALEDEFVGRIYSGSTAHLEMGRSLTRGEIGCALSHLAIYDEMLARNMDVALILEDDMRFELGWKKVIDRIPEFPKDWECVLLGHYDWDDGKAVPSTRSLWFRQALDPPYSLVRLGRTGFGTHGYCINQRGARKLISQLRSVSRPIDHYTGSSAFMNMYAVYPPCISLANGDWEKSSLENERSAALEKLACSVSRFRRLFWSGVFNRIYNRAMRFIGALKPLRTYR